MFWTVRQYALPVLFALLLHAVVAVWLQEAWNPGDDAMRIIKPRIIHSTLLVLEPEAEPPPKVQPKPQRQQMQPEKIESQADTVPERVEPREKPEVDLARQQTEREREMARQRRLQALADSSFLNALADESQDLAEDALAESDAATQSYLYGIYRLIVANWSRPPSARKGMQARLQVELVPTGDVVAVMLIESSGSSAFDRSAEAAVRKARRFEVPEESAVFEKHFRRFNLLFKPEDLLR